MLSLTLLVSCQEDKITVNENIEIPEGNTNTLKFGNDGGAQTISFKTQLDWVATASESWVKLSPASGPAGDVTIQVSVDETTTNRNATITINNGKESQEFKVEQSKYPSENNFDVAYTKLTLEKYADEKFEWHLVLQNEESAGSYEPAGTSVYIKLLLDKTWNYSKGAPIGEFNIEQTQETGTAIGVISIDNEEKMIENGSVELIKTEDGLKVGLIATDSDGNQLHTFYTVVPEDSYMFNNAYGSTIGRDLTITNFTQALIEDEGDIFGVGKKVWRLDIAPEDIKFKYIGFHEGAGEWMTITLVTSLETTFPVGKFPFVDETFDLELNTAVKGKRTWLDGSGLNSWWRTQTGPRQYVEEAPFFGGTIDIKENGDGTYTVDILSVDDALPENNTLMVKYNGGIELYDSNNTGDFAIANADFYGPFEFPSENMNWFIGLGDADFKNNPGGQGQAWVFDIMASPTQVLTAGVPYGKYTIQKNSNYGVGTCHFAKYRVYENYELKKEINIVSGSIEIKKLEDGRNAIIVDGVDSNGKSHKGEYKGNIPTNSVVSIPLKDRVFKSEGARVSSQFYGYNYSPENESPQKQGWDIIMEDETLINSNGVDGLGITLMLRTSKPTSFAEGIPVGIFPIYEPDQTGVVEGIYNGDFTYYSVYYQTTERRLMITGGNVIISKNGDEYNIELDLETANKEVRYTITGGYKGTVKLDDFSAPMSMSRKKNAQKESAKVLFNK